VNASESTASDGILYYVSLSGLNVATVRYAKNSSTPDITFNILDSLGSRALAVAADGSIVADPDFGTYRESTATADYSYTGKEKDSATGLVYFNARYYDPALGRFISEDPVKDGRNWYVYCENNPLKFTDPTGLRPAIFHGNPYANAALGAIGARPPSEDQI
jgi:RHS repeat-associated protein